MPPGEKRSEPSVNLAPRLTFRDTVPLGPPSFHHVFQPDKRSVRPVDTSLFCDFPTIPPGPTGKFQMAAVAELEAGMLSQRTKAALAAAKARGTLLGSARPGHWEGRRGPQAAREGPDCGVAALEQARTAAAVAVKEQAAEAYTDLAPMMKAWRDKGESLREIAARLNADGQTTRRGCPWNPVQVSRVLERAG